MGCYWLSLHSVKLLLRLTACGLRSFHYSKDYTIALTLQGRKANKSSANLLLSFFEIYHYLGYLLANVAKTLLYWPYVMVLVKNDHCSEL